YAFYNGLHTTKANMSDYLALINAAANWSTDASTVTAPFSPVPFNTTPALGAGSIAFTALNADGGDNLNFVVLTNITAGTVIQFTNDAWNGSSFVPGASTWSWTATSDIAAGTVVSMDGLNTAHATSNLGDIVYSETTNKDILDAAAGV